MKLRRPVNSDVMRPSPERFTCPCCGYRTFTEWPGSYQICHVCFWEDDAVQTLDPEFPGGANRPSLFEAQTNYREHGAMEKRFIDNVTGVQPDDEVDPEWRPLSEAWLESKVKASSI